MVRYMQTEHTHHKILVISIITLFLFSIVITPLALAFTVTNNGNSSLWQTATYPDFSANTNGTATLTPQQSNNTVNEQITITNATGGLWGTQVYFDYIYGAPTTFWYGGGTIEIYFVVDVSNGNEHLYSMFRISKTHYQWGDTANLNVGLDQQPVMSTALGITGGSVVSLTTIVNFVRTDNVSYTIQFQRINNTTTVIRYSQFMLYQADTWTSRTMMRYNETFTNSAGFWTNATARVFVGFTGNGQFSMRFIDMQTVENPMSIDPNDLNLILPDSMTDQTNVLTQMWNFLSSTWGFAITIWTWLILIFNYGIAIFWQIVPVLPYLLLAWLLDAVVSSIATKSFRPIGIFLMTLWTMFMLVIEKLLMFLNFVANAVAAVIPF